VFYSLHNLLVPARSSDTMSFKLKPKLLSRSRSGRVACVDSSASASNAKTHIEAEEPISNAMEKFLNNASCVVANVFSEAASMAHDMHTIITTDIDEAIVTTTTDIDEVSVGSAQDDKESAADQPARRTIKEKMKENLPSTITFFSKPMKESRVYCDCETRDFFAKPMKDETREDETETEAHNETNAGQPTCSRTEAEVEVEVKGSPPPAAAAAAEVEVKGSPATLAKLMKKHDKKTKQIEKLKQQLKKTEQEEVETKKRIRALAGKFRCVLNDSINGDADADDQNQTHDDQTQHRDKTHNGKNQTHDDKSENVKSEDYQSDDYQTDDDESEWEDEERDHDAIDLALWLVGQSP